MTRGVFAVTVVCLTACGAATGPRWEAPGGPTDASVLADFGGPRDAGTPRDLGIPDLGTRDLGPPDLGPPDLGAPDLGPCDTSWLRPLHSWDALLVCRTPLPTDSHVCETDELVDGSLVIGGPVGARYEVTLRIRGVVEHATIVGGTTTGNWNVDGAPVAGDTAGLWSLSTDRPAHVYWMNAGTSGEATSAIIDETVTIPVEGGTTVTLRADPRDGQQLDGRDASWMTLAISGLAFERHGEVQWVIFAIVDSTCG